MIIKYRSNNILYGKYNCCEVFMYNTSVSTTQQHPFFIFLHNPSVTILPLSSPCSLQEKKMMKTLVHLTFLTPHCYFLLINNHCSLCETPKLPSSLLFYF
ncbi:hypothetical protein WA026_009723 [Henosepilachna vigintioctopunctata]|uniref:Uncharacterized protein n=1 Tax=Henosepilachna vigintioctopunctata TaxID=420089 RepID=A0AAW1TIX3_9CUCU